MAKKTEAPATPETIVERVVKGWNDSWSYTSGAYHKKWRDWTDLYQSKRVQVGYKGISDTFVPMSFSTVETMVSSTAGDKPLVEYIQTKPEQATNTEVLNGLFSYYWDLDDWTNKKVASSRGYFKLGTYVEYYYWNIDHPCMRVIPLRDFFCDPTATILNYGDAAYMGYRFLGSKSELAKEQVIDPEEQKLVPKYKNLDQLSKFDPGDTTDKQDKDIHMGSTLNQNEDQIEVICYWTKEKVYYVGNRQQVIYEHDNYFKERQQTLGVENPTGMYPFVIDSFLADESLLYGTSVLDSILKPQELLNDLTNQNIDAISWSLDPVMELDPMYASYIDKIKNVTGAVYPFKPGSFSAVNKPQIPTNAFNERSNIKNEIRETTAIDEVLKGIATPSRTTATEVKAQVASAGKRFNLIVGQLESGGYYKQAKLVFQMVQMYVTQPTMYRVIGKQGVDWQAFDPAQFKGDYEPRVKLKTTLDDEKNAKMRDYKEMYSTALGNPLVNQEQLTRFVFKEAFHLEPDELDKLIVDPAKLAESQANQDKSKGKPPNELINYKDAPADIQAQIEMAAGFTPSVTHGGALETMATQHMAEQATNTQTVLPQPNTPPGVPAQAIPDQSRSQQPVGTPSGR